MPKVSGPYYPKGRIEDLLFYEMYGEHFVRTWTSLTGDRVKTDPAFALFRVYSGIQGDASRTSSKVYRQLPEERQIYSFYKILKSLAYRLLKQGFTVDETYTLLYNAAMRDTTTENTDTTPVSDTSFANELLEKVFQQHAIHAKIDGKQRSLHPLKIERTALPGG